MSNEIINLEGLGLWAKSAVKCSVEQDIFDLCLAIDIHRYIDAKSFDFRGEKIRIVEPNVYINDELYDIFNANHALYEFNDNEPLIAMFDKLKNLSLKILHRDIMTQVSMLTDDEAKIKFYQHGYQSACIYNVFSMREYFVKVEFPHKDNLKSVLITMNNHDTNEEINFDYTSELADYIVEQTKENHYFNNFWYLSRNISPVKSIRNSYEVGVDINKQEVVDIGPLRLVANSDNDREYRTTIFLHGKLVDGGENALHDIRSREAILDIIKENYNQFLKQAYTFSIIKALSINSEEIYSFKKSSGILMRRHQLTRLLNTSIKAEIIDTSVTKRGLNKLERDAIKNGLTRNVHTYTPDKYVSISDEEDDSEIFGSVDSTYITERTKLAVNHQPKEIVTSSNLSRATDED